MKNQDKQDFLVFGSSFLVHAVIVILLSLWVVKIDSDKEKIVILSYNVEEQAFEESSILDIMEFSEDKTELSNDGSLQPVDLDHDTTIQVSVEELTPPEPQESIIAEVVEHALQDVSQVGIGSSNEGFSTVVGVVDRLTAEIVSSASNKETLVVWMFDASISLSSQRVQIADRLDKILSELRLDDELYPIGHVVCSFGEKLQYVLPKPTEDKDKIVREIKDIPLDESGIENVFSSIEKVSTAYKSSNNKRVMIVVFTDEAGDDKHLCDHVASVASKNGTAVYVVGVPAPFGLAKTQFKFVDPDDGFDQTERWLEVDQGPESLFKMTLNISSIKVDYEPMESGFGPYALSRLCACTGGVYFALHPNRNADKVERSHISPMSSDIRHFFGEETMKSYVPDYRSIDTQVKELKKNKAKMALVEACSLPMIRLDQEFKTIFNAPNQVTFSIELNEGQNLAASLHNKVDYVYRILEKGKKDADELEPRWKASYFLAMGRILAIKTRLESYNQTLAEAKGGLKKNKRTTNRWILNAEDNEMRTSALKKQAKDARYYLQSVIDEFPGTPWALFAKEELKTPMSHGWSESTYSPVAMKARVGGGGGVLRERQDDQKNVIPYKPQRKVNKI